MKYLILLTLITSLTNCSLAIRGIDTWNAPLKERSATVIIQESVYSYGIYLYKAKISKIKRYNTSFYSYKEYCVGDKVTIHTDQEMFFLVGEYPRISISPIEQVLTESLTIK